jgi:hypothetical protein
MAVAGFLGVAFFNGVPLALVMMLFVFLAGGGVTASIAVDAASEIVTALLAVPALAATIGTPVPAAPAPAVWKGSDFRDGISSVKKRLSTLTECNGCVILA